MTESAPTNDRKMPNFEKARKYPISEWLSHAEIKDIQEGHVGGIFPLVTLMKIAAAQFTSVPNFIFKAPSQPILISKVSDLHVSQEGENKIFIGPGIDNFAELEVVGEESVEPFFLTKDERDAVATSPVFAPDLGKLPKHLKNWKLASDNSPAVDFRMREVDGKHNSNYGFFNLDLSKSEILTHLDSPREIALPTLVEIASQQVASVLGENDKSPVFQSIKIINPSKKFTFPLSQASKTVCDFRVQKGVKKNFVLQLAFNIDGERFVAEIEATQFPNAVIDRMLDRISK
jgi:hypothetical protein